MNALLDIIHIYVYNQNKLITTFQTTSCYGELLDWCTYNIGKYHITDQFNKSKWISINMVGEYINNYTITINVVDINDATALKLQFN